MRREPSQTVWHMELPTIMWCNVHETTHFIYDRSRGLRCSKEHGHTPHETCEPSDWFEFHWDPDRDGAYHDSYPEG